MRFLRIFRTSLFLILLLLFLMPVKTVYASEVNLPDIDYTDIQNALDYALDKDDSLNFKSLVEDLTTTEDSFSFSNLFSKIKKAIGLEFESNLTGLIKLLTIAVIAAVFTNFSHTFQNSQVADTGFYVTYLLMFVILSTTFIGATQIASSTLTKLLDFMKALVPSYCMTVAFCTGVGTSAVYYEGILALITVVNVVLVKAILPLTNIYMMATLANNLSSEDMLSKLADLLATVIRWILKTLLAVVIGIGTIQSLVAPAIDQVKRSSVMKATNAVPGVGGVLSGVAETILGAGVLLKNCIGVGGLIAVLVICAIPVVKLVIYVFIFKLLAAAIQPISDRRITNCVSSCSCATVLLLQTLFVAAVLFEIAITIVAVSTMKIG